MRRKTFSLESRFPRMTRQDFGVMFWGRGTFLSKVLKACEHLRGPEDGSGKKRRLKSDSVVWWKDLNSNLSSATS